MTGADRRAADLHTREIPATRLAGLAVVTLLIPLHNAAVFGDIDWPAVWLFGLITTMYGIGSWLILKALFLRSKALHLGIVFLVADVFLLIVAINITGGPKSWLFFLLAARCMDQLTQGFRRVVWFNHLLVGSYGLLLVWISLRHGGVNWKEQSIKLTILYAFNWYCALTARAVASIRMRARRASLANRASAEFVGMLSHAIRTAVSSIVVFLELLEKASLNPKQQEYAESLSGYSRDLISLVNALDSAGMEPAAADAGRSRFSPRNLVNEVASLLRPTAQAKGIDLRVEIAPETPQWVTGDSGKLRRVLLNLAQNAVSFTEVGFVELSISQPEPGRIGFQVRDSGPGIPAHIKRRLFAPFVRADGSGWDSYRGQKSGLVISKRLVDLMGGNLELTTKPGSGSAIRFTLELPTAPQPVSGQTIHAA